MRKWRQMNIPDQKNLKKKPEDFCKALKRWIDAGDMADVGAALLSALASSPRNSVRIDDLMLCLDVSLHQLAVIALSTGVPVNQLKKSCVDARAAELVATMTDLAAGDDVCPPRSHRRENRHPYVLTRAFLIEVAHDHAWR